MEAFLLKVAIKIKILLDEQGQDLVEYGLVLALIAFAAAAGMSTLASALNTVFTGVGTTLTTYIS